MTQQRRCELTAAIKEYILLRRQESSKKECEPDDRVQYSLKNVSHVPEQSNDWDALVRIFSKHKIFNDVHTLVEQAVQEETFSQVLLRMIRERRLTEPEVYNAVFMDRRLFNKIRNTPEYQPNLRTALMLAIALRLNLEETREFIGKAGFTLSPWRKFDVIVEYFIVNEIYDIFEINEMLAAFDLPPLLKCE
jgi:hypothetical protein